MKCDETSIIEIKKEKRRGESITEQGRKYGAYVTWIKYLIRGGISRSESSFLIF